MQTPLLLLTLTFGYNFLAGVFGWGTEDSMGFVIGLVQFVTLIWMWVVFDRRV